MKQPVKLFLAWMLLLLCASACRAATYYVSPKGDDSKDGASAAAAWKSCQKASSTTLQPGDSILFERGGEWREQLAPSFSGTQEHPIVFGAYGNGAKPKFWGSEILVNANFTLTAGTISVYKYALSYPVDRHQGLAINHVLCPWTVGFGGNEAAQVAKVSANPLGYWIDDGFSTTPGNRFLYLNTNGSDPRADGKVYTLCIRENVIHSAYKNYLTFRELVVDESAKLESGYGVRIEGGQGVRLERCEAYRVGVAHFGVVGGEVVGDHLLAAYAMPNQTYIANSAYFSNNIAAASVQWLDCAAEHLENYPGQRNYMAFSSVGAGTGSTLVKNMTCIGNGGGRISLGCKGPVSVLGGTFENAHSEQFSSNVSMDGVTFLGTSWIDLWGNDCLYQNCKFINCKPAEGGVFLFRDNAKNNTVRFCTILAASGACMNFLGAAPETKWYGNIMLGNAATGGNGAGVTFADYNFYADNASIFGNTLPAWQGLGRDTHSKSGDPKFVDPASNNFSLQGASTCIDAAAGLKANDIPPTDAAGATRPQGAGPDMGAYEGTKAKS